MPKLSPALTTYSLNAEVRKFEKSPQNKKKLADGGCKGLYLVLQKSAVGFSKYWKVITTVSGTRFDRSLYGLTYPECGLAEARKKAEEYLKALRMGVDPLEEKARIKQERIEAEKKATIEAYTFRKAVEEWMSTSIKAGRWINDINGERKAEYNLRLRILPIVGDIPINEFKWVHVYEVMMSHNLYMDHPEQAKKCRALINSVCLYAHANGYREADDEPARLTGALKAKLDLVAPNTKAKGHEPRIEPDDVPAFFAQIGDFKGVGARMLELCILTASRPGMLQKSIHRDPVTKTSFMAGARWDDIDLDAGTWRISPNVMKIKGREEFIVYLSSYAVSLLRGLPRYEGCPWVFSRNGVDPIGAGVMARVIDSMNAKRRALGLREWIDEKESHRLGRPVNASPHGIARSSFRTWLTTDKHKNYQRFNVEAIELCLAHFVGDSYGGGYNRPELTEARRECMEAWGRYCTTGLYPDE